MTPYTIKNLIEYLQTLAEDHGSDTYVMASVWTSEEVPDVDSDDWPDFCEQWTDGHGFAVVAKEADCFRMVSEQFDAWKAEQSEDAA